MGQWDDSADIKTSREAHHTFHFSLFTFHLSPLIRFAVKISHFPCSA